jgi:hypothetical protein
MIKLKLFALLILFASCVPAMAQDVEFIVTAPNVVAVGEQFRLVYKLNARPQEMKPPSFANFYILAGPSTSTSSSIQVINGQMTQTYEFSYTYILEATTEGKFTLEPATAIVSKREYQTQPLTIEVVKGSTGQSATTRQQQSAGSQEQQATTDNVEEMFVAVEYDRQTAYRGQPILATIKIFTRENISGFEEVKFPSFTGFWSQEVETPNNINFDRVNFNGRIYNMGILKKYLLFPQRTGEISVEPFEIVVLAQQRGGRSQSIFDDFFGSFQTVRRRLTSKPTKLKIRDLPQNAPASFTGAVGKFNMEATLDKSEIKTNEAVNLKIRVAGSGNLRLIESPKVEFPGGFEVFDPKTSDRITTTTQGATGSRTFDYVAIPRGPGKFDLGSLEFSYFDPITEKYVSLRSKPLSLEVEADGSDQSKMQMVGFGREDIRFIGQDIRFIKVDGFRLNLNGTLLFASTTYYIYVIIIVLFFITAFWWIQQQRHLMGNIALVRTRKANRVAKRRLKMAQNFLAVSNAEQFHEELLKAMWGYVSDKLSIPVSNLSYHSSKETLRLHGVDEVDVDEFLRIISVCEYARYAPKDEKSQMAELYQNAIDLISKLEGVINR